jgi:Fe-S oxidoreductase
LGRGCGIYQEPRDVLNSVAMLMETPEEREHSLCCGFNLGNTVIELEQQEKIRNAALENLQTGNPDLICTACPMCKKAFTRATEAKVMDVAELVSQRIDS